MEATGKKTTVTDLPFTCSCEHSYENTLHQRFIDEMARPLSPQLCQLLVMAVGMDNGLMTPVVYNAEKMSSFRVGCSL